MRVRPRLIGGEAAWTHFLEREARPEAPLLALASHNAAGAFFLRARTHYPHHSRPC